MKALIEFYFESRCIELFVSNKIANEEKNTACIQVKDSKIIFCLVITMTLISVIPS